MTIVSRITQYGSLVSSSEFNEIGQSKVGIGTTNIVAYEFNENILEIVTSGLVMNLDAANKKSYPGSGNTWTDLSGNGNNGTLLFGPTYSSVNGGSIVFDGIDDRVIATRPSSIVTGGQITISLWAKWLSTGTDTSTIQALIDNNHRDSPLQGFVIQDRPDLGKFLTFSPRPDINGAISTFIVGDGSWHHIVGTCDGSTVKLYIDGNFNAEVSQSGGLAPVQPNIALGRWQGGGRHLNGNIAQVSIYNRALTASEVLQNYDALKGRFATFSTNVLTANGFPPYNTIYSEFVDVLYGTGGGTYVRQKSDQSLVVYNEFNELDLVPTVVLTPSKTFLNEGGDINFAIATTNVEDGIPIYYEILTPPPTATVTQSATSIKSGNSVSFNATTVNIENGTTLSYEIIGSVSSSDFTDNTLTGITTVIGGIINTITKTTTGNGNKSFILSLINDGNALATSSAVTITPPVLYDFTSATFTSGGANGIDGPTLAQARTGLTGTGVDAWKNDTAFFNTSNGIQLWTVPDNGNYKIRAMGGSGGRTPSFTGGRGAIIEAVVSLTKGQVLKLLVGQGGTGKSDNCATGAGGGTFVTLFDNTPLVVAGGGSGTASQQNGLDAVTTRNGGTSATGTLGGTNGSGGGQNQGPSGAGLIGNGAAALWGNLGGTNNGVAQSFVNGGQGGTSTQQTPNVLGGFGGGASGHGNCCIGEGGGGGYSGGGGASSCQPGGGGGSFIITSATNVATSNGTYDGSSSFNGSAIFNLGAFNTQGSAISGSFAPNGSVIITKL